MRAWVGVRLGSITRGHDALKAEAARVGAQERLAGGTAWLAAAG